MPERPRSHRLEDESRRAFEAAVEPKFKFYARPQPEYGIDGEVEEFDERDRATGLHFFVQLKGTDEPALAKALAVDIKVDTANYYRAAPLPVLMVRYHAPTQSLYVRWFHQYDPYEGRGGTKTLTFRCGRCRPRDLTPDAPFADWRMASSPNPAALHPREVACAQHAERARPIRRRARRRTRPGHGEPWLHGVKSAVDLARQS